MKIAFLFIICYINIHMKKFFIENKNLIILWVLCGIALFIFCGHYSNILLDIGREIYYPQEILNGKVLYKDLFNIYGPFAYLFNALLYKIFTPNLSVLYFSGIICSFAIVSGTYLIARKFLSEFLSFAIGIFTIICGVCAPHLFNYTLPYSFAMLYGTVGLIFSLLFLIKYGRENKTEYLYIAALSGGFCVSNKYDFILYGILLFAIALFTKNKKIILNFITCFMFVPLICLLTLFIQGVGYTDYVKAYNDISSVITSESLAYFYSLQGIFFNPKVFLIWIINILKTGLCFIALIGGVKILDINKILGWLIIAAASVVLYFITTPAVLVCLVPLTIVTVILCCKKLKNNIALVYLALGTLSVCGKSFWVFLTMNYGNYIAPALISTFLALIFTVINSKYQKAFGIGLIVIALHSLVSFAELRVALNYKVSSEKGTIYTFEKNAETTNSVISGLIASNAESAVIYPEGLIINFLANVKSEDYYNSMLPLYIESLGENKFIDIIRSSKPDFIILTNQNMHEYGADYVCDNYAKSFCDELLNNYNQLDDINDGFRYIVFGRK